MKTPRLTRRAPVPLTSATQLASSTLDVLPDQARVTQPLAAAEAFKLTNPLGPIDGGQSVRTQIEIAFSTVYSLPGGFSQGRKRSSTFFANDTRTSFCGSLFQLPMQATRRPAGSKRFIPTMIDWLNQAFAAPLSRRSN
jgi:hypothetical protein